MEIEDASQMNVGGPPRRQKTDRSFHKCDNCRHRKCKCLPVVRDFDKGERCESCVKLGLPCGPHRRYYSQPGMTSATHTAPSHLSSSANTFGFQPILPRFANTTSSSFHNGLHTTTEAANANGTVVSSASSADISHLASPNSSTPAAQGTIQVSTRLLNNNVADVEEEINRSFDVLSGHIDLIPELHSRYYAAIIATPTFAAPRHIVVNQGLELATTFACEKTVKYFKEIFHKLRAYNGSNKELHLKTLLDYAHKIPLLLEQVDEQEHKSFQHEFWHHRILEELIDVCDESGRTTEADRLCHVLLGQQSYDASSRSPTQRARLFEAYRKKSELMDLHFRNLGMPRRYHPVPDASCNQFPPTHLAVRQQQFWAIGGTEQGVPQSTDSHDVLGRTLIQAVVETNNPGVLNTLLQEDSNSGSTRDALGMTPAAVATIGGHLECLDLLMQITDYRNERDSASRSLLRIACDAKRIAAARLLLDAGMNPHDQCLLAHGGTTLDAARDSGQQDLADLLQQKMDESFISVSQQTSSLTYSTDSIFSQDEFDS